MKARSAGVLSLALLLDLAFGDPPNRRHPVAWMGAAITVARRHAPGQGRLASLTYGALLTVGGVAAVNRLACLLGSIVAHLPVPWGWLVEAGLLKLTFSVRGLTDAARQVETALSAGNLPEARQLLAWHLVSRDTGTLDQSQVAAATIESIAENASDGVVAPLLCYAVGGLPAAWTYRFINTTDSMLGYRDQGHEWLGKVPARLDDLANFLPARLTAGLLLLAAALIGEDVGGAWRVWRRDAGKTASPNAGHPMSAAAGALGVELQKVGHYSLGVEGRRPKPDDIKRATRLLRVSAMLAAGFLITYLLACGDRQKYPRFRLLSSRSS
jgi:adenosylcobinamide-phosphate synthase